MSEFNNVNDTDELISDLMNGDWKDIIKSYNIEDLYLIIGYGIDNDDIVANENFGNNLFNLIKNDWNNIINYPKDSFSIIHNSSFNVYSKDKIIANSIKFMNNSESSIYNMFDFLIDNKDFNQTLEIYNVLLTIPYTNFGMVINTSHILEKIKENNKISVELIDKIKSDYQSKHYGLKTEDILILKDEILNHSESKLFELDYLLQLDLEKYEVISKNFELTCNSSLYKDYDEHVSLYTMNNYVRNENILNKLILDKYLDIDKINHELIIGFMIGNNKNMMQNINKMCSLFYISLDKFDYDLTEYGFPLENIAIFNDVSSGKKVKLNIEFDTSNTLKENIDGILEIHKYGYDSSHELLKKVIISFCHTEFKEKEEFINCIRKDFKSEFDMIYKELIEENNKSILSLIEENYSVNNDIKEVKRTKLKRW